MTLQKSEDWHRQVGSLSGFVPKEDLDALKKERDALRASIGAIHWNAGRSDADAIVLLSIKEECEHAIPELSALHPNAETSQEGNKKP